MADLGRSFSTRNPIGGPTRGEKLDYEMGALRPNEYRGHGGYREQLPTPKTDGTDPWAPPAAQAAPMKKPAAATATATAPEAAPVARGVISKETMDTARAKDLQSYRDAYRPESDFGGQDNGGAGAMYHGSNAARNAQDAYDNRMVPRWGANEMGAINKFATGNDRTITRDGTGRAENLGEHTSAIGSGDPVGQLARLQAIDPEKYGGAGAAKTPTVDFSSMESMFKTGMARKEALGNQKMDKQASSAMAIAKLGHDPQESASKNRLYGAQADVAEGTARAAKERDQLETKLSGMPEGEERTRLMKYYAMKFGSKDKDTTAIRAKTYSDLVAGGMDDAEARTLAGLKDGGVVRGYADGGQIYGAAPQANPLLAKYGQYLQAAATSGVPPVPFAQYMKMSSGAEQQVQGQAQQAFADGGLIGKAIDSIRSRAQQIRDAGSMSPPEAQGQPQQPAPQQQPMPDWYPTPEQQKENERITTPKYADGGEIDGPGTGRSDSVKAVVDGHKPVALSDGEYIIPAHVVRAKGTEFFDKLLAQYDGSGGKANG